MIVGHKPSGYFQASTGDGIRIEGETHACCHCQYTWEYKPGSGIRRGWCLNCNTFMCGRGECVAQQKRILASFPDKTRSCMPWTDMVNRQRERFDHDPRFKVLPSGIVIAAG